MLPWAGVSHSQEEKLPQKGVRITVWATHDKLLKIQCLCHRFGLSRNTRGSLLCNRRKERPLEEPIGYKFILYFHFSISCFQ